MFACLIVSKHRQERAKKISVEMNINNLSILHRHVHISPIVLDSGKTLARDEKFSTKQMAAHFPIKSF